ncbi:MAG: arginase family protein [Clostridiales bacterium]|jgi:arginase|nr:arginase family protein [Clostridiales bacterium]
MNNKFLKLLFPQWQGSVEDKNLYNGVQLIKEQLLKGENFEEIPVSLDESLVKKNNIIGYDVIFKQLNEAVDILNKHNPDKIFLVGGDCGTELAPVTYLNKKLNGDLFVIWIDAHGDLNTPESSPSKAFHGMPLRAILGDGDPAILDLCYSKLSADQVSYAGGRDFDQPEIDYIKANNIKILSVEDIKNNVIDLNYIKGKGYSNVYIHLDLDALDPGVFPDLMLPVPDGFDFDTVFKFVKNLKGNYNIAGFSIQEFSPIERNNVILLKDLVKFGLSI